MTNAASIPANKITQMMRAAVIHRPVSSVLLAALARRLGARSQHA